MATVLVADDQRDIRAVLTTLLTSVGYDVLEAADMKFAQPLMDRMRCSCFANTFQP